MGKSSGGSSQTIGYAYFLGIAYALATKVDKFVTWKINGDNGGDLNFASGSKSVKTGNQLPSKGSGNNNSNVTFYNGMQTEPDEYLSKQTKSQIAYKNVAYCVINGFIGDNVRSAPNYSVVVERTNLVSWANSSKIRQNLNGDVNPACALWYMFTSMIGLNEKVLDKSSFINAAEILTTENLGVSFVMSSPQEAKEWVEEILRTIDGIMAINPKNGLLSLRLLRDDYDVKNLKFIDEGNSNNLKFKRKSWDETYSRVTIKFTDRKSFESASVVGINSATKETLGYERAFSTEFMAISSHENANKVLQRQMKKLSYPVATLRFNVSSEEFRELMVGDVLLFTNKKLGVKDMRIRVLNLGGEKDSAELEVEAMEDVFALNDIIITSEQESLYTPIDLSIGEIEYYGAVEATIEMGEQQGVLPLIVEPSGFLQFMEARDGMSGKKIELKGYRLSTLITPLGITEEIDNEAYFDIKEITPLWKVAATRAGWQRLKFTCLIDSEFINFQFRDDLGDGRWRIKTLMRGLSDTKIASHSIGAKVWFAPIDANDLVILPIISQNTTLYFNAGNFANKSETKKLEFNHSGKARLPYPISNLKAKREGQKVVLTWKNRVRLHGANYRSADVIPAGIDEGLIENYVLVKFEDKDIKVKDEILEIECEVGSKIILYNVAFETGLLSEKTEIII